jgi:hypothetical protein
VEPDEAHPACDQNHLDLPSPNYDELQAILEREIAIERSVLWVTAESSASVRLLLVGRPRSGNEYN